MLELKEEQNLNCLKVWKKRNMIWTHMALSMLINLLCQSILIHMEETSLWFIEQSVLSTNSIRTWMVGTNWLLQPEPQNSWAPVQGKMWAWVIGKGNKTHSVRNQLALTFTTFSSANGFSPLFSSCYLFLSLQFL